MSVGFRFLIIIHDDFRIWGLYLEKTPENHNLHYIWAYFESKFTREFKNIRTFWIRQRRSIFESSTNKEVKSFINHFVHHLFIFHQEEHQPCIWMKRQMEAAVMLAWVWFGIAIVFSWNSFDQAQKKRFIFNFWGAKAV